MGGESPNLKGLRLKWRRTAADSSLDSGVVDMHVAEHSHSVSAPAVEVTDDSNLLGSFSDRGRSEGLLGLHLSDSDHESVPDASIDVSELTQHRNDLGGSSTFDDDCAAVSDQFIRGARLAGVTMPWETPLMRQIFSEDGQGLGVSLTMPLDWGTSDLLAVGERSSGVGQPPIPSQCRWSCAQYVVHKTDETYLQQRDRTMNNALAKWKFLVLLDPARSEVGRQIGTADHDSATQVLTSVMGVKSPNTVLKRACALMMYYRWNAVHGSCPMLPLSELDVWRYVMQQSSSSSSASRSHSLVQALRFCTLRHGF